MLPGYDEPLLQQVALTLLLILALRLRASCDERSLPVQDDSRAGRRPGHEERSDRGRPTRVGASVQLIRQPVYEPVRSRSIRILANDVAPGIDSDHLCARRPLDCQYAMLAFRRD